MTGVLDQRRPALAFLLCVAVACGVGLPAFARQDSTETQFRAAYEAKQYPKAIELGLQLVKSDPASFVHPYNLACVYCLSGDSKSGLEWLKKAADLGFDDAELFRTDPDLASIRGQAGYAEAQKVVEGNAGKSGGEFMSKAKASEPLVILPSKHDPTQPATMIVALHPFGGTAETFADQWRDVAEEAGAILVLPRAVRPQGTGFAWGNVGESDVILTTALDKVKQKHKIDEKRVVLTGFSQGGQMAFNLGVRHPLQFAGVIPVCGVYDPSYAPIPLIATTSLPRFFIMVGATDQGVESNRKAAADFVAASIKTELRVYPGIGHAFPTNRKEELLAALKFVLGA